MFYGSPSVGLETGNQVAPARLQFISYDISNKMNQAIIGDHCNFQAVYTYL